MASKQRGFLAASILLLPLCAAAQERPGPPDPIGRGGLLTRAEGAFEGYTLFAPIRSTTTYLVDLEGKVVHQWESDAPPGQSVYLLENGNLLRTARAGDNPTFHGGGEGGRVQEIAWDGSVVWDFRYSNESHLQHHDVEPLPNGNVLMIAWERRTAAEAIAAGRDPERLHSDELWPDCVVEIEPQRPNGGKVVWEWHLWDHLIQDCDPSKDNWGEVAKHPELVDVNVGGRRERPSQEEESEELRRLRELGYIGGDEEEEDEPQTGHMPGGGGADWTHVNSVAYNAELDQIVLSVCNLSEIWVIDHGTTTEEAAGHSGGRSGRGGDLLYRWGNPQMHRAGTAEDQQLFGQHDAQWIPAGLPGAGHLLLFNNGSQRGDRAWSSVDELVPPLKGKGSYARALGAAFGPDAPVWTFSAEDRPELFSERISGAQRLPNGNTLMCSGEGGRLVEVTASGEIVWEYVNPFGSAEAGGPRGGGPPPEGRRQRGGRRPQGPPPGGRFGGPPPGRGGPGGGPGGGRSGGVFRATRYSPDHPGLKALQVKGEDR